MRNIIYIIILTLLLILLRYVSFAHADVDTSHAVIHHTDSGDVSVDTIRDWHVNGNGWQDVGYHFIIRANGVVEEGRSLSKAGAHARGRNNFVGIALTGRDTFTTEQKTSLVSLCRQLHITRIERHHEQCPGPGLTDQFFNGYNKGY